MDFTLEQNAADSLRRSVRYFIEDTPSGLKAAVKELASAIELYVKHQLVRADRDPAHPVLIYEHFRVRVTTEPPAYDLEPTGEVTVGLSKAMDRLKWLGYEFSKVDREELAALKRLRNAMEHHFVVHDSAHARQIYAAVAAFAMRYLHTHLGLTFLDLIDEHDWYQALRLEPKLHNLAELSARQIYEGIVSAEAKAVGTLTCAQCGADCMVAYESYYSGFRCVVCGFRHSVEMCSGCKKEFFLDLLTPSDGETLLCSDCDA